MIAKQNCNTYNQISSKITLEKKHGKSFGSKVKVKTNVAKMFLQLIDTHFPPRNKFHQIFNRSTVKVNHSCNQNISQIIKGHNKKVKKIKRHNQLDCNCRTKTECPLNGDCRKEDQIFKCTALTIFQKSASWSCRG